MIRVGIVGAGYIGGVHAQAINYHADKVMVAAAADIDDARRAAFVAEYGAQGFASLSELLAGSDVDAVLLCLPHDLHCEAAIEAFQAGKHVMIEKPMALSIEECDRISTAAADAGTKLMVAQTRRFYPGYAAAGELLRSGEVGEPYFIQGYFNKDWTFDRREAWLKDRQRGGGMWFTNGVHTLDALAYFAGSEVESVKGDVRTVMHDQTGDDAALALLQFANGIYATVTSIGFKTGVYDDSATIYCTNGIIRCGLDWPSPSWARVGQEEHWREIDLSPRLRGFGDDHQLAAFAAEWQDFLRSIEEDTDPAVTGDYSRHLVAILTAVEESSRLDKEVEVAETLRVLTSS
jgi:predicted dehydrogenase